MLLTMVEGILGFIIECLLGLFWWILVIALFRRERYSLAVTDMLASVDCFWSDWGLYFTS